MRGGSGREGRESSKRSWRCGKSSRWGRRKRSSSSSSSRKRGRSRRRRWNKRSRNRKWNLLRQSREVPSPNQACCAISNFTQCLTPVTKAMFYH